MRSYPLIVIGAEAAGLAIAVDRVITKKWSSQILGCTIVGSRAGEMLGSISPAKYDNVLLHKLAGLIFSYPGYNQAIKKAANLWLTQALLSIFKRKKA